MTNCKDASRLDSFVVPLPPKTITLVLPAYAIDRYEALLGVLFSFSVPEAFEGTDAAIDDAISLFDEVIEQLSNQI